MLSQDDLKEQMEDVPTAVSKLFLTCVDQNLISLISLLLALNPSILVHLNSYVLSRSRLLPAYEKATNIILNSRPVGAGSEETKTWELIKRPTMALIEKYYNRAGLKETDKPLLHSGLAYFDDEGRSGTRDRAT